VTSWQPSTDVNGLVQRAALLQRLRQFFAQRQVLEVQTPVLAPNTVTDPDVESIAVPGYGFLQTSPEYQMKRLLAVGAPSIYQLAPAFRHEEVGRLHNSEFTMLEWYRLDFDHGQLMEEVADLVDEVLGPASYTTVTYAELVGDLDRPRDELDLAFAEATGALNPGRFFVVDYPADQGALARLKPDNPAVAARFELVIDGVELANGYWELLDPSDHLQRFQQDQKIREARGLILVEIDRAFIAALNTGLPTCAGVALGVDRLLMLAMGERSLDKGLTFRNF
jgi:lysyl-tRNA synthetase class 2